ncbi:hypothetical protein PtA15_14A419 [Puccinia triticina]|uniref:YDG domain-containing protein n=1 Tax=Puccinia triticina TaxID=208348 RepID=A0ABY7D6C1_9BASI|nr:uncharacterized protein PtA15_14A419 [Puccinia triticina]WAQ91535.1 hypothetical protein PtA15_14A419 [Puccinia triticina]
MTEIQARSSHPCPSISSKPFGKQQALKRATSRSICKRAPSASSLSFGHIPNVLPGQQWQKREQVSHAGVHKPYQNGIWGTERAGGAYSVVLSNAYHDYDCGDIIWYMGSGGFRRPGTKQVRSTMQDNQNPHGPYNSALQMSLRTGHPVRVVRGSQLIASPWAPVSGYRYDGLYKVTRADMVRDPSGVTSFKCVVFRMERVEEAGYGLYELPVKRGQATLALSRASKGRSRKIKEDEQNAGSSLSSNKLLRRCKTSLRPAQQSTAFQTRPTETLPSIQVHAQSIAFQPATHPFPSLRAHPQSTACQSRPNPTFPSLKANPPHEDLPISLQPVKKPSIPQNQATESPQPGMSKGVFSLKFKRRDSPARPVQFPETKLSPVLQSYTTSPVPDYKAKSQSPCSAISTDMSLDVSESEGLRPERLLSPLPLNDFTFQITDQQSKHSWSASPDNRLSSPTFIKPSYQAPIPTRAFPPCPTVPNSPVRPLSKASLEAAWQFASTDHAPPQTLTNLLLDIKAFTEIEHHTCSGCMQLDMDQSQGIDFDPAEWVPAIKKEEADISEDLRHNDTVAPIVDWPQPGKTEEVKWEMPDMGNLDGTELESEEDSVDDEQQGKGDSNQTLPIRGPGKTEGVKWEMPDMGNLDGTELESEEDSVDVYMRANHIDAVL